MSELTRNDQDNDAESGQNGLARCRDLTRHGYFADALADLVRILARAKAEGDVGLTAGCLYQTAWCCMKLGKTDAGLECVMEARRLFVRHGDVSETARAMALESLLLLDMGLADEGYEEAEQAISAAEMSGDVEVLTFARNVKACILAVCGQPELARPILEHCLSTAQETGDTHAYAFYHLNLGFVYYKLFEYAQHAGDADAAINHLDRAVSISEQTAILATECGDLWTLRSAIANAAELNARAGHLAKARELLDQWESVPGDPGASTQIHYLYTRGDILMRQGELGKARDVCTEGLRLADANNQTDHQVNCVQKLADIHAAMGEYETAFSLQKRHHALFTKQTGETARRRANTSAVRMQTAQWRRKASRFADQALRDPLTGIANRRCFDQKLAELAGRPVAIAMLDLDHFKQVNDTHSHIIGDQVLKRLARILATQMGEGGLAARLGGEEFGMICPGLGMDAAVTHCDKVRAALAATDWSDLAQDLAITTSIGLVTDDGKTDTSALVSIADRRLYAAKRLGRDRVVSSDTAPELSEISAPLQMAAPMQVTELLQVTEPLQIVS